jgi:hypothetical protein
MLLLTTMTTWLTIQSLARIAMASADDPRDFCNNLGFLYRALFKIFYLAELEYRVILAISRARVSSIGRDYIAPFISFSRCF